VKKNRYNVILIALDTLRADHLGVYGYRKPTSPVLDLFSENSMVFENFFAPAIPTQPSFSTVFTGQFSLTHGIVAHGGKKVINPYSPWLPEIMADNGFTTCAVDNLAAMKPWFLRGYEFYINPSLTKRYAQIVKAEDVTKRAIEWIDRYYRDNFFLFLHYWDPHTPYIPPDPLIPLFYSEDKNPFSPNDKRMNEFYKTPHGRSWGQTWLKKDGRLITDPEYVEALYDAEIRYMDEWLKKLFNFCSKKGLMENTVFIIFSDHGEVMYKHSGFFDHHGLYDDNIHCTLIIYAPEAGHGKVDSLVQHVDIAPTILNLSNIKTGDRMEGNDLSGYLSGTENPAAYRFLVTEECTYQAKWAIRDNNYKLITSRKDYDIHNLPLTELYNLSEDKLEQNNIAVSKQEIVRKLQDKMEQWIDKMLKKNKLKEDPLRYTEPPLGKNWEKFVKEHRYW
jgi:arylsulfatase